MKPEIKIYMALLEKLRNSDEWKDIEQTFIELYPDSFNADCALSVRLERLPKHCEALKREAVSDYDRKLKNSVLFPEELEKIAKVESYCEDLEVQVMTRHPEGFIR